MSWRRIRPAELLTQLIQLLDVLQFKPLEHLVHAHRRGALDLFQLGPCRRELLLELVGLPGMGCLETAQLVAEAVTLRPQLLRVQAAHVMHHCAPT